jgi:hypothetical protein
MKKVLNFIAWWWRNLDTWQKGWLAAAFVFGAGVGASDPYRQYLIGAPVIFIFAYILKWMFWDGIRDQWLRFNKEQDRIVEIMRDGK